MLTHEDKRRHARRTLSVEFRAGGTDGLGALELSGADLSAGGAFLVSDLLLEPGEMLSLEFQIAWASAKRVWAISGGLRLCRICWSRRRSMAAMVWPVGSTKSGPDPYGVAADAT